MVLFRLTSEKDYYYYQHNMSLILHAPRNDMPTLVEDVLVGKYLDNGYTLESRIKAITKEKRLFKESREKPVEAPVICIDLDFINHFDQTDLVKVRGIGPALAQKIMDARPFASKDDLEERLPRTNWENILKQPMP